MFSFLQILILIAGYLFFLIDHGNGDDSKLIAKSIAAISSQLNVRIKSNQL